ncbi:hypothetical protein [Fimbriiglobus ruber]|uniref:Uncharacterized protein n=1 Tax=Fimbriiglobus ruber TaxID=1908690 RepID=A0A225EDB4_9BACT|nr:hypothetical protein [Fimbriiglobus ruber]OWK46425.1 hypothetical protein FRUB_00124 [Fimbriiglobus ruber]
MNRMIGGIVAFAVTTLVVIASAPQSPGGGEGGEKKGPPGANDKGGPPRFELGKVLPPFVLDELDLTDSQKQQIAALEKDVKTKLNKILTTEQKRHIQTIRPPHGPGPGPGPGPGGPGGRPKDDEKGPPPRPDND